jgi:hypothetical protein
VGIKVAIMDEKLIAQNIKEEIFRGYVG